jgi:DNA invertase Pin-like site-specific DNA recombinase
MAILDRLGRSLIDIIKLITSFEEKGIELISLTDNIDTKTPMGRAMYKITATFAELERDLIRERTKAGLKSARSRGKFGGRPKALTLGQIENLKAIYETKKVSINEICEMFKIKKPTLYKYLKV